MIRAVAYARVSTYDEKQNNSLTNQEEFFREEIIKKGFELVTSCGTDGVYIDKGLSGTQMKNRRAFMQMLEDAKQGKFDILLTKEVSRFARNTIDTLQYTRDLKKLGIGVYFETDNINTLESEGELKLSLMAILAQEESRKTSDRVKFGLMKSAKNGIWKSTAPYGYDKINKYLVINEQESEIVKKIYNLYYSGWGVGKITRQLNENEIPTKKKVNKKPNGEVYKVMWSQNTVTSILKNSIYIGKMCQHKTQMTDPILKIIKIIPEDEWIIKQDETIRIIDNDLFSLVQEERKKRNELFGKIEVTMSEPDEDGNRVKEKTEVIGRKGRYSNIHIFSNLLYCKNCGVSMKRKKRHAYIRKDGSSNAKKLGYEWVCTYQDMYGKKRCNTLWRTKVTEEYLIEEVKSDLKSLLREWGSALQEHFMYYLKFKLGDNLIEKLPEIESNIERLDNKLKNNFDIYNEGIFTKEQFTEIAKETNEKLEKLKEEKNTILNLDRERRKVELKQKEFKDLLSKSDLNNLTNEFLRKIIRKIYIEVDPQLFPDADECVAIWPIYDFGIDITSNEIMRYADQWVKEDSRKEAREKRMCKGKIYQVKNGNIRNYKKHRIIVCCGLQVIIDDEGVSPGIPKTEYDFPEE